MTFIVLFERDRSDHVFDPLGRPPTNEESGAQLFAELTEADISPTLLGSIGRSSGYDVFAVTLEWNGSADDLAALMTLLIETCDSCDASLTPEEIERRHDRLAYWGQVLCDGCRDEHKAANPNTNDGE